MKVATYCSWLAATAATASAFSTAPLAFKNSHLASLAATRPSLVVLDASRNREKIASRSKWCASRGIATVVEEASPQLAGTFTSDEGLEYVRLVHPETGSASTVFLFGGVVTSYVHGGVEFVAVRPDAKMDGSKPISGGLSHCWPQFGPGEIQQHGFARNLNWDVVSSTDTSVVLELNPSDYTKEMWDKPFKCTFTVTLEADKLATSMKVDNVGEGEASFDFQAALHSYFTVSALENLEISGSFENKEFLNKMVGDEGEMQTETRGAITIGEEYDRVYKGVNDPVLSDKGTGTTLTVDNTAGYEDTVLWSPYGSEAMGYNNFVCVESVKVRSRCTNK
jgi:glucose-6-phosphate 1-epimerase